MEKYTHLEGDFVNLRELFKSHLRSFFKLPEQSGVMVIGVVEAPVLTEIFHHNVPPLTTYKMVFHLLLARNGVDS